MIRIIDHQVSSYSHWQNQSFWLMTMNSGSSSFAPSNWLYLNPCSPRYQRIWKLYKTKFDWFFFPLFRSIPFWSYRKIAATCYYRYPFISFIIWRFLYRIPRSASKTFANGTHCVLEALCHLSVEHLAVRVPYLESETQNGVVMACHCPVLVVHVGCGGSLVFSKIHRARDTSVSTLEW